MESPLKKCKVKKKAQQRAKTEANEQRYTVWMNEFQSRSKLGMTCPRHTFCQHLFLP